MANARRHELATLEHLLLSLIDEPDAARVMKACSVDLDELRKTLIDFIDDDLSTLVTDVEGSEAVPTAAFQRVIQRAAIHVQSSGRTEVTGANVLVAIFAERESNAAYFLQEQDMTRYDAVNFIAHGVAKDPSYGEARPVPGADEPQETPKAEAGEAKESALSKYCVDLNVKAPQGRRRPADRPRGRGGACDSGALPPPQEQPACWWATPASARPPSPKAWPARSSTTKRPRFCRRPRSSRSTWARCWPAPAIAATSRNA